MFAVAQLVKPVLALFFFVLDQYIASFLLFFREKKNKITVFCEFKLTWNTSRNCCAIKKRVTYDWHISTVNCVLRNIQIRFTGFETRIYVNWQLRWWIYQKKFHTEKHATNWWLCMNLIRKQPERTAKCCLSCLVVLKALNVVTIYFFSRWHRGVQSQYSRDYLSPFMSKNHPFTRIYKCCYFSAFYRSVSH